MGGKKQIPIVLFLLALPFLAAAQASPGGILQFGPSMLAGSVMLPFPAAGASVSARDAFGRTPPGGAFSVTPDAQNANQLDITLNPGVLPSMAYVLYLYVQSSNNLVIHALTYLGSGNQLAFYQSAAASAPTFPNNTLSLAGFPNPTPGATAVFGNGGIQIPPGHAFAACLQTWSTQVSRNCLVNYPGPIATDWITLASAGACCATNQALTVGAGASGLAPGRYYGLVVATDIAMTQVLGFLVVTLDVAYTSAFPHLVTGLLGSDIWSTSLVLMNQTAKAAPYQVSFYGDNGQPATVFIAGQNLMAVSGNLPPKSQATLQASSTAYLSGWAGLSGAGVTGQAVFHRHVIPANEDYEGAVPHKR